MLGPLSDWRTPEPSSTSLEQLYHLIFPFCLSTALLLVLSGLPIVNTPCPVFYYSTPSGPKLLTHSSFITYLQQCLAKLGINPSQYYGHSFRRGGASFALQCCTTTEWIKLQGDWASDAYELYTNGKTGLNIK